MSELISNTAYKDFLIQVKNQIRSSQAKAALAVNSSLIYLYWNLGKLIAEKQEAYSWGNSVIENLSTDLKNEFPDGSGFSTRNLFEIRRFYLFYGNAKVQQLAALLQTSIKQSIEPDSGLSKVRQVAAEIKPDSDITKVQQLVAQIDESAHQAIDDNSDYEFVRQLAAQIPWGHHLLILNKIKEPVEALFYILYYRAPMKIWHIREQIQFYKIDIRS